MVYTIPCHNASLSEMRKSTILGDATFCRKVYTDRDGQTPANVGSYARYRVRYHPWYDK